MVQVLKNAMRISDPFAIPEPGFEPYAGPIEDPEFSQPDRTPSTVKDFLRSEETQRAMEKIGGVRAGMRRDAAGRDSLVYQISRALRTETAHEDWRSTWPEVPETPDSAQ